MCVFFSSSSGQRSLRALQDKDAYYGCAGDTSARGWTVPEGGSQSPGPREGLWLRPAPPSPGAGYNNPALYQTTVAQPEEGGATQRVPEEATWPLRGAGDKPGEKVVSARGGVVGEERSKKRSRRCCHHYCIVIYF